MTVTSMVAAADGSLIVAGSHSFEGKPTGNFVASVTTAGLERWVNDLGPGLFGAHPVAVDANNDIVVVGRAATSYVRRLGQADGLPKWAFNLQDGVWPQTVATSSSHHVVVAGLQVSAGVSSDGKEPSSRLYDVFVAAVNDDRQPPKVLWKHAFGGPAHSLSIDEWRFVGTKTATVSDVVTLADGTSVIGGCTDASLDGAGVSLGKSAFVVATSEAGATLWSREFPYPGTGRCDVDLVGGKDIVGVLHWASPDASSHDYDNDAFDVTWLGASGNILWNHQRPRLHHQVASTGMVALADGTLVYGLRADVYSHAWTTSGFLGLRPDGTIRGEASMPDSELRVEAMASSGGQLVLAVCPPMGQDCRSELRSVTLNFHPGRSKR